MHNLIYALIQVVHNFGAAAIIGFTACALWRWRGEAEAQRRIFIAIGVAWLIQGASGVSFGIASLSFYGKLPDIHGVALAALAVKILCVATALIVTAVVFKRGFGAGEKKRTVTRGGLFVLGVIALSAAGFLRWFS